MKNNTKEIGLLFKAEMVRAILENRKWVTRRLVKPQPNGMSDFWPKGSHTEWQDIVSKPEYYVACGYFRFGKPGDVMYVREAWARPEYASQTLFKADYQTVLYENEDCERPVKWKPGIHLPKSLSRIRRKIVSVRPERLQDITEEDAIAEGVNAPRCPRCGYTLFDCRFHMDHKLCPRQEPKSAIPVYAALWDRINPKHQFSSNPWIVRIEFERKEVK